MQAIKAAKAVGRQGHMDLDRWDVLAKAAKVAQDPIDLWAAMNRQIL